MDDLRPEENPIEHVRRLMPNQPEAKIRAAVARMGLSTEKMMTKAKELSGGEKARLLMGLATFEGPNLLILDEPTNHLDIDSREALVMALNDFEGAVILIAHDRHLIEATADRLWLVRNGTVHPYEGDMDDYRNEILGLPKSRHVEKQEKAALAPKSKNEQRKANAEKRAGLAPLKKQITDTEALMERLQKLIARLDAELAAPDLYAKSPAKAAELAKERADAVSRLEDAENRWLKMSADYETAIQ